jgi:hypothetical protein
VPSLQPLCYILSTLPRQRDHSQGAEQVGDKSCLVTVDAGTSVMITNPDITAILLNRGLTQRYILQMASGETLPTLREVLVELALVWHPLMTWFFHQEHRRIHPAAGCLVLRMRQWIVLPFNEEDESLWDSGVWLHSPPSTKRQQQGGANSVWENCGNVIGRPSEGS